MKQLQINFTTPEQSKRLLELGVPEDSADCYYYYWAWYGEEYQNKHPSPQICYTDSMPGERIYHFSSIYPCWSVGRLMEIYNICLLEPYPYYPRFGRYENMINIMIDAFVFSQGDFDFSKLED